MTDSPQPLPSQDALNEADTLLQEEFALESQQEELIRNRRQRFRVSQEGVERRQFSSNYSELSAAGAELGKAIDSYKVANRRRYITYDEILLVLKSLGYARSQSVAPPLPMDLDASDISSQVFLPSLPPPNVSSP